MGASSLCCFFTCGLLIFFLLLLRPPRSTLSSSSAASDVYKRQDETQLKDNISQKYYEAHKLINTGQKDKAFQTLFKAIKLENALHLDDKEKPLYAIAKEEEKVKRYDYFNFSTFQFKETFDHEGKDILQYLS
eukprot:TRINITY_DN31028_c0_g1_i1.p1 TRINITY_DN31028_c0_g1~~TRINITY_DN31028_c0_g1_i1.p1  ORF type:complete len:133 (+),score=22.25 TRINITY_DN31028_c0_g1_i1:42-440(+)